MNQEDLNKIDRLTESIRKEENNLSTIRGLLSGKNVSICIQGEANALYKREYRHFVEDDGLIETILKNEQQLASEKLAALKIKLENFVLIEP